jgi:hypothetical protein
MELPPLSFWRGEFLPQTLYKIWVSIIHPRLVVKGGLTTIAIYPNIRYDKKYI